MRLYLLRHAIAGDPDPVAYPDDAARPITSRGLSRLRRVLDGLKELEVECQRILTSPYLRARQSADEASRKLGAAVELCPGLEPHGDFRSVNWSTMQGDTMVVGHEPDLSRLGSWLLTGSDHPFFSLKKAGVACLERDDADSYTLLGLYIPKIWTL